MIGIEQLNNSGMKYIGEKGVLLEKKKTLIVVGVARGGTSLISGSLDHLGVFTGENSRKPVFEDTKLARAFEGNNNEMIKDIIEEYNQKHSIWSFKRPMAINYLNSIDELTRNPIYLIIFKDIFSISNRNNISMKQDIISGLAEAHENYGKLIKFISQTKINAFLFSYEKIMISKEVFIDTLINLIGEDSVTDGHKNSALEFIRPNPGEYLNASRITKSVGKIGFIDEFKVIGWGKYISSEEPANVELYVNDQLIEVIQATDFRQHVLKEKIHSTGKCGFLFDLKNSPLKDGDKVSVKLTDDIMFLKNSNQIFKKENAG